MRNSYDPQDIEQQRLEAAQAASVEKERQRQEGLLLKDALRLLRKDRIKLDDISETFIFRKLLSGAFSQSATERQWAVQQLMQLKGMKIQGKSKPAAEDDDRLDLLDEMRPKN